MVERGIKGQGTAPPNRHPTPLGHPSTVRIPRRLSPLSSHSLVARQKQSHTLYNTTLVFSTKSRTLHTTNMRTFGFIAAFAAFTSVFAAPFPAPGSKSVAVRIRDDLPATPAPPATPAAPGQAGVQDSTIYVGASLTGICVGFQVNVHTIVTQIHAIIDPIEGEVNDTVNGTVTTVNGVTADVSAKVDAILSLLNELLAVFQDTLGQLVNHVVADATDAVDDTKDLTVEDVGQLLRGIEKEVSDVLYAITALVGTAFPAVAACIKLIIINLSLVLKAVVVLCGGVSTFLSPLNNLIGSILATFEWSIPDLF